MSNCTPVNLLCPFVFVFICICPQSASLLWTFESSAGPDGTDVGRVVDIALRDDYVFALCDRCHTSGTRGTSGDGGDEDHIYTVVRIDNKVLARAVCGRFDCLLVKSTGRRWVNAPR